MEDLFAGSIPSQLSAAPVEKEFTVSEISFEIKKFVESNFNRVRVKGEIFGGKRADSGHWYLSLKDENALLSAVIWKGVASRLTFKPEDGLEVIATGKITTFAGKSSYQLVIDSLEIAGTGALLKLLEAVVKEPNKAENWIKLGNFQFDNQNPSAAVTAYENALRLKPGNANVLTDLGIMYRELHRFEDALKAFREAERVQPGHRNALFNQGIVLYYDLKRKDEAEAAWRKLLAADPNAHAPDGTPVSELIKHLH